MKDYFNALKNIVFWMFGGIGNIFVEKLFNQNSSTADSCKVKQEIELKNNIDHSTMINGRDITIENIYNKNCIIDNNQSETSFTKRFFYLQKLLNDARVYGENEYTIEYISSLIGFENVSELKKYISGDEEPSDYIKQKFVDTFGVNRDWMLFNRGEYPFATNIKNYTNGVQVIDSGAMDILRNEKLFKIQQFIVVLGIREKKKCFKIIRKTSDICYELYPHIYNLDDVVGETGKSKLVSFYRFLSEADRINKLSDNVYCLSEEEFTNLHKGSVAPLSVRKCKIHKSFTMKFLCLEENMFDDEKLESIKRIIKNNIDADYRNNKEIDRKLIEENLVES